MSICFDCCVRFKNNKRNNHKIRSAFDRYNIANDQNMKEAARKKQTYDEKEQTIAEETTTSPLILWGNICARR